MSARPDAASEQEHTSAVSETPTAWITLTLVVVVVLGWLFLDPIACGALRVGLTAASWWRGDTLRIQRLATGTQGWIEARGVEFQHGPRDHRSSWKSDLVRFRLAPLGTIVFPGKNNPRRPIQELQLGATKVLVDRRATAQRVVRNPAKGVSGATGSAARPGWDFFPSACVASPVDIVVIGENYRMAVSGLSLRLPDRWTGRISYNETDVDLGTWHRVFPKASATALWEGNELRIGALDLGKKMALRELTLAPRDGGVEFGIRAIAGSGQLRGDGAVGRRGFPSHLDVTLVGENLNLASFNDVMPREQGPSGTVSQARFTFRGDTDHPMDAESSLRVIARDIRWQGLDWESLRVAATMTGRNLTLSELTLEQGGNELVAQGQSQLPPDWRQALKSPFTARFHADLEDAHALSAWSGSPMAGISGALYLEGEIQGADNKARGYCNARGSGLKIRDLPLDWVKGCLMFEGEKTRLSSLEAFSGEDRVYLEGVMANSRPHAYEGEAEFVIRNLTKRLTQLGVPTAPAVGSGGVKGTWQGSGSMESHSGTFQADVNEWVSRWTASGMTGRFEGSYAPGKIDMTKAEVRQDDLRLSWKAVATPRKLVVSSILATREGNGKPLVEGSLDLPVDAADLWQSGSPVRTLGMREPLDVNLALHGIDARDMAKALGQKCSFAGSLEGNVTLTGTPSTPEIHTALRITHVELPQGTPANNFSVSLEATNGLLAAALTQEPRTNSPLSLSLQIPLTLTGDQGSLTLAQVGSEVRGEARFRKAALDGWASMLAGNAYPLRGGTIDGDLTLTGTLQKPDVHGAVTLTATQARLFGSEPLSDITLPVTLTNAAASLTNATASYAGRTLSVSGTTDWSGGSLRGGVHLDGNALPLPIPGVRATGNASLLLSWGGTNQPLLGGTIGITALESCPRVTLTPVFAPPGLVLPASFAEFSGGSAPGSLQVDLTIKTSGSLPVASTPSTRTNTVPMRLSADLHLLGKAVTPATEGRIDLENALIDLPAGRFVAPAASLRITPEHGASIHAMAFGMTKRGLFALGISSSDGWTQLSPLAPAGVDAPEAIRILSTTSAGNARFLLQGTAWLRQQLLYPLPCEEWIMAHQAPNDPAALGFYGTPWVSNWEFVQPKPATN